MKGLDDRVEEIKQYATEHGWECISQPLDVEGCDDAVGVGGVWVAIDPDTDQRVAEFMFTVAFGTNPRTGRVNTFEQGQYGNALFVITVEDGTGRYWTGPLRSWRRALADPLDWTDWVMGDEQPSMTSLQELLP